MKKLIFAGAAALALAFPAVAQDVVLTPDQVVVYNDWPEDRRTAYDAWPADYRTYYWTLSEAQQSGWWALTDAQRTQLYAMTPEARVAAWASIERQMASMPSANASATAQVATTAAATQAVVGEPRFVSNAVAQTTPAAKTDYPLCSATVTDGCVNPREAGKNYGNRPLNYWPGRPASEIPGPKPQK